MQAPDGPGENKPEGESRIPAGSVFFRRVLPVFLVVMGMLTLGLILVAAGVLLGVVPWR